MDEPMKDKTLKKAVLGMSVEMGMSDKSIGERENNLLVPYEFSV